MGATEQPLSEKMMAFLYLNDTCVKKGYFMKLIKKLLLLLLTAIVLFFVASCKRSMLDPHALTIVGLDTDFQKVYLKRVFVNYQRQTGRALNIIAYPPNRFNKQLKSLVSNNNVDIILHGYDSDLEKLDPSRNFVYLTKEWWVDDLVQLARLAASDNNDNIIGLPFWENSTGACYYNKKMFDKFGLRASTTANEFETLSETLYNIGVIPVLWDESTIHLAYQAAMDEVFFEKPDMLNALNLGALNFSEIPEIKDILTRIRSAADSGWLYKSVNKSYEKLWSGDVAMILSHQSWAANVTDDSGLYEYCKDDFAVMPILTGNSPTYETGDIKMFMININTQKLLLAKDFLSFCATKENYNKAFDGIATNKVFKEQKTISTPPALIEARNSLNQYSHPNVVSRYIKGYSTTKMDVLIKDLVKKNITVDECLNQMDLMRKE